MDIFNLFKNLGQRRTATVTMSTGTAYGDTEIRQVGQTVFVHVSANGLSSNSSEFNLCSFTGVPFPKKPQRFICGTGTQLYNTFHPAYGIISTNGYINILKSTASDSCVNILISYPVD